MITKTRQTTSLYCRDHLFFCLAIPWVRAPLLLLNVTAGGLSCLSAVSMHPLSASLCFPPL